ncbi:unnamed protein product [Parajaminaea phylloscopi]
MSPEQVFRPARLARPLAMVSFGGRVSFPVGRRLTSNFARTDPSPACLPACFRPDSLARPVARPPPTDRRLDLARAPSPTSSDSAPTVTDNTRPWLRGGTHRDTAASMHSHHSHSGQYCSHAHPGTTPESMLNRAEQLGFHTYGLSEHVPRQHDSELYPEERDEGTGPEQLMLKWRAFLTEARRQQKLRTDVRVLVGAETENICPTTLRWLRRNVFDTPSDATEAAEVGKGVVDYLVGSLHHVGGHAHPCCQHEPCAVPIDFDDATFRKALQQFQAEEGTSPLVSHRRLTIAYLDAQYQLLQDLRPEVIGHFDLCRLFEPSTVFVPSETDAAISSELDTQVEAAVARNISFAVSYGALFEINSASLRKGWDTPYPGRDVLRRILDLGGRVCLSDDAHGDSHVAISYARSRAYLIDMGVRWLWHLELQRDDTTAAKVPEGDIAPTRFPRGTVAVAEEGWASHAFWSNLDRNA